MRRDNLTWLGSADLTPELVWRGALFADYTGIVHQIIIELVVVVVVAVVVVVVAVVAVVVVAVVVVVVVVVAAPRMSLTDRLYLVQLVDLHGVT